MTDLVIRSSEVPANFKEQMHMAQVLSESTLLPAHLRGKPANVLLILQGARALDVAAFWALQSMHVIEGKLGMSAELMRGLAVRAGHKVRVVKRDDESAIVEIQRKDRDDPYRAEFSWKDAVAAKLQDKDNWKKYRKSMLVARATSIAMRDECPDVLFGVVYTPDELGAVTDADENPVLDNNGKVVVDGEVIQVTSEQLDQFALRVTLATAEQLPVLYQELVAMDIVNEKVPGSRTDESLADTVLGRLRHLIQADETTDEELRTLWKFATATGLITAKIAWNTLNQGTEIIQVGDAILRRKAGTPKEEDQEAAYQRQVNQILLAIEEADLARLEQIKIGLLNAKIDDKRIFDAWESKRAGWLAQQNIGKADGEVSEEEAVAEVAKAFDLKPEDIDTENARRLREEAEKSWGE